MMDIIYYDGRIIDQPLLVPTMPSNDQRNLLTQTKFSKKVILNLTPLETQILRIQIKVMNGIIL